MRRILAGAALAVAVISLSGCTQLGQFVIDSVIGGGYEEEHYEVSPEEMVVPDRFTIIPDDYHAEHAGVAEDGRSFFFTPLFDVDNEFLAIFYWNADGSFDELVAEEFGPRDQLDEVAYDAAAERMLASLGATSAVPISVEPFAVEKFGTTFGFVPTTYDGGLVAVELLPGNFMAYYWPWDGEGYDT